MFLDEHSFIKKTGDPVPYYYRHSHLQVFKGNVDFTHKCTGFAFRFEPRKWNRGRNGLHQLGQPVAPSVPFPVFKSEGEPGIFMYLNCNFKVSLTN